MFNYFCLFLKVFFIILKINCLLHDVYCIMYIILEFNFVQLYTSTHFFKLKLKPHAKINTHQ